MMPRLRTLKPGFFRNETLSDLPERTRLLFAGLWCWSDKAGRMEDRPRRIGADIFPYAAIPEAEVDAMLSSLAASGFLTRYTVAGSRYLQVVHWDRHQKPHKTEAESVIPPADNGELTVKTRLTNVLTTAGGLGIGDGGLELGTGGGGKARAPAEVNSPTETGWHANRDAVELARRWASINPKIFAASKASHHFASGILAGIPVAALREAVETMKGRKPFEIVDALKTKLPAGRSAPKNAYEEAVRKAGG